MKFTFNNVEYDTEKHLIPFVDENTGETHLDSVTLDKQVRLLWFRSKYPDARISSEILYEGIRDMDIASLLQDKLITDENKWSDYVARICTRKVSCAIAKAEIYLNYRDEQPAAISTAERYAEKDFTYNVDAAINAAIDKAIRSLGFITDGELKTNPVPISDEQESKKTLDKSKKVSKKNSTVSKNTIKSGKAIENIQNLIDETSYSRPEQLSITDKKEIPVEEKEAKSITLEEAFNYKVTSGAFKDMTLKEIYEKSRDKISGKSDNIEFLATKFKGDNNLKLAAQKIVDYYTNK